jgi:hypothetical protein
LLASCSNAPDYSSKEAFIEDFIKTLLSGEEGKYPQFFVALEDFDNDADGVQMAIERFTGTIKAQFLNSCNSLSELLKDKDVEIVSVEFRKNKPRILRFIGEVEEHYEGVEVYLDTGSEEQVVLTIQELYLIDGKWRMTTFTTLIDQGTERMDPVNLEDIPDNDDKEEEEEVASVLTALLH